MLTGELEPDTGKVTRAATLRGRDDRPAAQLLDPQKAVRDVLAEGGDWIDVRGVRKHVQGYLKDFLFDPGGRCQRSAPVGRRTNAPLLLAREFARTSNLLVLDEPTNDLDLETLDLLQEVIADYEGTVLIVSHDRDFLDRTVTVTLGLDGSGTVDVVAGGYEDWAASGARNAARRAAKARGEGRCGEGRGWAAPPPPPPSPAKLSYKDQRDYEILPARIEELDKLIANGEAALADPGGKGRRRNALA
jgi:ABC transport system ATP-binding/permease protein